MLYRQLEMNFTILLFAIVLGVAYGGVIVDNSTVLCGENEEYSPCNGICSNLITCQQPGIIPCPCGPGCACKPGYLRIKSEDKCVLKAECANNCGENQEYKTCALACPRTCALKDAPCSDVCVQQCACKEGYILKDLAQGCILGEDCPAE